MIDLYYWPTPNGWKISIALEEVALAYRVVPVNIGRGEQFEPEFLRISPNNRIPAIVDHAPADGGEPIALFESAAILTYLAEKTGQLLPQDVRGRFEVLAWLAWQVANLGPTCGQAHHFRIYAAAEPVSYAADRFTNEVNRLYGVLDRRLADREWIAGAYSIADVASFPWILPHRNQGQDLADFPSLRRWYDAMKARPAVRRGVDLAKELRGVGMDDEARKHLFGQAARKGS